jgi:APA family basic amino acid/polyamine antiporter
MSLTQTLFGRRKSMSAILNEARAIDGDSAAPTLKRTLGPWSLTAIGVAGVIGTGIFVLLGHASAQSAGPAIVLSFVLAGIISTFAAFCYAELASMVPIAGSAYTYVYATLGEIFAWIVGWALVLEYAFGAATVGAGWSGYLADFFKALGHPLSAAWTTPTSEGGIVNLPAIGILILLTLLLIRGTKEGAIVNNILVALKVLVVIFFIIVGAQHVNPANWHPFNPHGFGGISEGAALIFFAYIGFDMLTTAAEESANPGRDLPFAILMTLGVCTVLYILVGTVLTGMVPYTTLNVPAPVSSAMIATGMRWGALVVTVGTLFGLTTVLFVQLFGQARIAFSMGRDGLLPPFLQTVHAKRHTPWIAQLIIGAVVIALSATLKLDALADLVNMGTLFAFVLVAIGVWLIRVREPHLERKFRTPVLPLMSLGTIIGSCYLIITLPQLTKIVFFSWMAVGLIVYFAYSRRNSKWKESALSGNRLAEALAESAS